MVNSYWVGEDTLVLLTRTKNEFHNYFDGCHGYPYFIHKIKGLYKSDTVYCDDRDFDKPAIKFRITRENKELWRNKLREMYYEGDEKYFSREDYKNEILKRSRQYYDVHIEPFLESIEVV